VQNIKTPAIIAVILALICSCNDTPPNDDSLLFTHNSPRPECRYSVDPDRVPYYSEPGPAVNLGEPVNSIYLDGEHALSPDGLQLFLTSTRPGGLGGTDIWVSTKEADGWSVPENPNL